MVCTVFGNAGTTLAWDSDAAGAGAFAGKDGGADAVGLDDLFFRPKLSTSLCFTCPSSPGPLPNFFFGGASGRPEGRTSFVRGTDLGAVTRERGGRSGAGKSLLGCPNSPGSLRR